MHTRPLRRQILLGLVAAACLLMTGLVSPRASAEVGGDWIVFTRDPTGGTAFESGDEELYAIRLDGTSAVRLTTNSCIDITPSTSGDGRWLAWVQKCGSAVDILMAPIVYDETGLFGLGAVTNVSASLGGGAERWPQFSPDGTQLAFMRKTNANFDIYRAAFGVSALGVPTLSGSTRVVRLGGTSVEDCCVTWSPDGLHLVWASNVNVSQQSFNLYRVASNAVEVWDARTNVDGSRDGTLDVTVVEQLTAQREYEGTPSYDADGTILFRCNCSNPDVWRLDPVTKVRTRLTTWVDLDRTPEGWPGGIVYSRLSQMASDEIFVAGADGSNPRSVTNHPQSDVNPTWVPPQQ